MRGWLTTRRILIGSQILYLGTLFLFKTIWFIVPSILFLVLVIILEKDTRLSPMMRRICWKLWVKDEYAGKILNYLPKMAILDTLVYLELNGLDLYVNQGPTKMWNKIIDHSVEHSQNIISGKYEPSSTAQRNTY